MSVEVGSPQIGRLVQAADFERVLRHRSQAQSVHFALHHVAALPSARKVLVRRPVASELSTEDAADGWRPVDDSLRPAPGGAPPGTSPAPVSGLWWGAVVPKRHARRAVTRTLLKRQIRAAVVAHAATLAGGLWVIRLRAGFDRTAFPSAASVALQTTARDELDGLLIRCTESISTPARSLPPPPCGKV